MMEYPALMYRCPGAFGRPGGTYSNMGVNSEDEAIAAIEAGWYETLPEAIAAHDNAPKFIDEVVIDGVKIQAGEDGEMYANGVRLDAPETPNVVEVIDATIPRSELEAKAKELGIKVDGRWSDKRLRDEVEKAS